MNTGYERQLAKQFMAGNFCVLYPHTVKADGRETSSYTVVQITILATDKKNKINKTSQPLIHHV